MARMRGVSAVCLVLLLAAGASIAQDCLQKVRTRSGVKTNNTADRSWITSDRTLNTVVGDIDTTVNNNLECVFYDQCDGDDNPPNVDNADCDCLPYYDCQQKVTTRGPIVIRINHAYACENALEVCCSKPRQVTPNTIDPGKSIPITTPNPLTPNQGCGQRNEGGVGFRITGNVDGETQFGEFPWMVALLEIKRGVETFIGGGALINPRVVLTAAHTVFRFKKDPSNLRARAGEWDSRYEKEIFKHQQLEVKEVIIHEDYWGGAFYNDIALLVLRDEVEPAEHIGMLCLPAQGTTSTNAECIATGWGKDSFGNSGCYQVILKSILLPMVPRRRCEAMLRKTRLGKNFTLHSSATCAGGEGGKDVCNGDGGGPLACPIPGEEEFYEQVGIVSWGIGCGDDGVPGVYTNVAQLRNWVDDKFNERNLDTESYQRPI